MHTSVFSLFLASHPGMLHGARPTSRRLSSEHRSSCPEEEQQQIGEIGTPPGKDGGDISGDIISTLPPPPNSSDRGCEIPISYQPDPLLLLIGSAKSRRRGRILGSAGRSRMAVRGSHTGAPGAPLAGVRIFGKCRGLGRVGGESGGQKRGCMGAWTRDAAVSPAVGT
jgi:hypothetical protein